MAELTKMLWHQFEKQKGVDFVFKIVDENDEDTVLGEFGVHSIILATQSSVFDAILNGNMKEKSPLTLKDTKPDIFKKFLSILYDQDTAVFSLDEAQDLYYLGAKYDFSKAIQIAKKYMMENIDFTNATTVYECANLFEDKELESINWKYLEKFILKTMKGLECLGGKEYQAKDEYSFEVMDAPESTDALEALKTQVEEIRDKKDVKKKVGYAMGFIKSLIEGAQKTFRLIVPNEKFSVVTRLEENGVKEKREPKSSFEKLNQYFSPNTKCMVCVRNYGSSYNHMVTDCTNYDISTIYQKYQNDDLTTYSCEDINTLYNHFKSYLPA